MILLFSIIFLVFFLLVSAILSASETAFFSLSSPTLRSYAEDKNSKKQLISKLLKHPRELLFTLLMLNVLSNILIQNVVSSLFGNIESWVIKVGIPFLLVLFLGEILPKSLALVNNQRVALFVAPIIAKIGNFISPFRKFFTFATNYASRFLFFFLKKENPLSIEELKDILLSSKENQILDADESDILTGYLDLYQVQVKEKMKPLNEIIFFDLENPIEELYKIFSSTHLKKIPLCHENLENFIGVITLKALFAHFDKIKSSQDLTKFCSKPLFAFESMSAITLLNQMLLQKEDFAMVVDEYGALQGLITDGNLVSLVIGKKEKTEASLLFSKVSLDVIIASGKLDLDTFEKIFHIPLKSLGGSLTLAGWLIEQLEEIPQPGTKFQTKEFLFYILEGSSKKIDKIYVRKLKKG